jgi:Nucleoside phosphorylase
MNDLLVFAALRLEAAALPNVPGWTVLRTGMGPARARIAAARGLAVESPAVAIAGVCGAVSPELRAGDVVCATELRREDGDPIIVPAPRRSRRRYGVAACAHTPGRSSALRRS